MPGSVLHSTWPGPGEHVQQQKWSLGPVCPNPFHSPPSPWWLPWGCPGAGGGELGELLLQGRRLAFLARHCSCKTEPRASGARQAAVGHLGAARVPGALRGRGCLTPRAASLETLITWGCSLPCLPTSPATASHFPVSIPTALPAFELTSDRTVSPTGPLPVLQPLHGLACATSPF